MQKLFSIFCFLFLAIKATCQTGADIQLTFIPTDLNGPLFVGHRGGFDSSLPENSISNFDFTFANACQVPVGIEFDIRKSASGSLFIMHDSTVDRTTNGTGNVSNLADSYLESLFLRGNNGILTKEKVLHFMDILQHFQSKNIVLMLDVKGNIFENVISMVKQMNMESQCILLTFNKKNTQLAKSLTDKMMISALVENAEDWQSIKGLHIGADQLIAYIGAETPAGIINDIHANKVLLMTDMSKSIRNKSKRYESEYYSNFILKMQLDILISDYPLFVSRLFCKK